jgi:hypothetical protein
MKRRIAFVLAGTLVFAAGYWSGGRSPQIAYAKTKEPIRGFVPKSYGKLVTGIADSIGTGVIFESEDGVVHFVSITGMKEGELPRY